MSSRTLPAAAPPAGRLALAAVALCAGLGPAQGLPAGQESGSAARVVVLGFDGADARTVRALMDAGALPNMTALAEQGTFAPLATTNPAESPVSWSSLNTGQNPAKTGIPGFVVRQLAGQARTPLPDIGFYESVDAEPIERLAHPPLPVWPSWLYGLLAGALVLIVFLLVLAALLRLRARQAVAISLVLAAVGAYAGVRVRSYLPATIPVVKNVLKATPFWEVAARSGVSCVVLDAAQAWDRTPVRGAKVLAGLGVPDARGQYNGFSIYTGDETWFEYKPSSKALTPSSGYKLRVDWNDDRIESRVYGPSDFWSADKFRRELEAVQAQAADPKTPFQRLTGLGEREQALEEELARIDREPLSVPLTVVRSERGARVTLGNEEQDLEVGQWSGWYRLTFELNPLIKVRALARAKLLALGEPHFKLYVDALQIDPEHPPFWQPISQPAGFSRELAHGIGPFETVGWACMTLPFKDAEIDPVSFLQDIEFTFRWGEALTLERLGKADWRLFMSCLSTPDRVQHMMYQYYDSGHPLYDEEAARRKTRFFGREIELRETIPVIYEQVDRIVGYVLESLRPEDTLLICADHGFQSFRHQFHVNNWLEKEGYLVLRKGLRPTDRKTLNFVDWAKTRAYALGLGTIYLNLQGRERDGIVRPEEADALMREIAARLLATIDERPGQEGARVIDEVTVFRDVHDGRFLDREGDLMLGLASHYRVSWGTTLGDIKLATNEGGGVGSGPFLEPNDNPWSGDHVSVAPKNVPGIFFCSRKVEVPEGGIDLLHIAPTALSLLGMELGSELDRAPLVVR